MNPALIGVIALLSLAAIVVPLLIWYFRTRVWLWKVLPLPGLTVKFYAADPAFQTRLLENAVLVALEALSAVWPRDVLLDCTRFVHIYVVNAPKWQDGTGQWVGGQQDGPTLRVCSDLSSLMHELAHWVEEHHDGVTDYAHKGWAEKNLWTADEAYRTALKQ